MRLIKNSDDHAAMLKRLGRAFAESATLLSQGTTPSGIDESRTKHSGFRVALISLQISPPGNADLKGRGFR